MSEELKEEKEVQNNTQESGGIKGWFKKAKGDVNNFLLESKIENTFNKNNEEFSLGIYDPESILNTSKQIFGYFDNDSTLVIFGEKEVPASSILVSEKSKAAYRVINVVGPTPIEIVVENTKYIRSGTRINVDTNVKEVKVIKVSGRTFLFE